MLNIKKFLLAIGLVPKTSSEIDSEGELEVVNKKLNFHNGTSVSPVVTEGHAATLTDKIIDADLNTITNIDNSEIKVGANITRAKLANGTANRVVVNNASGVISDAAAITANRALISNASGIPTHSTVTNTELGHVSGVTSAIQTQLNAKQATITGAATTIVTDNLNVDRAVISNASGKVAVSTVTSTELGHLSGVTSSVQTQINTKATGATTSTNNAVARYDGTTGKLLKDSSVVVLDNGSVGVGTTTPNASALLDVSSTTQGFLPPRMTTEQRDAIVSPAAGLIIKNTTTNTTQEYNGFMWEDLNNDFVPSVQPSLDLKFAETRLLPSEVTFSRDSIGSFVNKFGLLELAQANQARFDHNPDTMESLGLLVEEQRQNLLQYSENFDNSYWNKSDPSGAIYILGPNSEIAPDGTRTATLWTDSVETSALRKRLSSTSSSKSGSVPVVVSFFVKKINVEQVRLSISGSSTNLTNSSFMLFDFSTETFSGRNTSGTYTSGSQGFIKYPNGWYRLWISATTGEETTVSGHLYPAMGGLTNYQGTGTPQLAIWGAQLEVGSFPTSYIPSTNSLTSRASSASFIDSDGLIKYAANNVARSNYRADKLQLVPKLLLEESRQNLLQYSENFDNAVWVKTRVGIQADVAIAPDGTLTADKLVEDTSVNLSHVIQQNFSFTSGVTYTHSIFVKAAERTIFRVTLPSSAFGGTAPSAYFDLANGTFYNVSTATTNVNITPYPNGWYRCSVSGVAASSVSVGIFSFLIQSGTTVEYTGDGVSGLFIWGAQLEVGSFPTSYIPSTNSLTSRASSASYIDSDGLVKLAGNNVARSNYRADKLQLAPKLLLEESRQNLLQYTENFDNSYWLKSGSTILADSEIAPDGSRTADKLVINDGILWTSSSIRPNSDLSKAASAITYTFTFYAKAREYNTLRFLPRDPVTVDNNADVRFNLSTGTVISATTSGSYSAASGTIQALSNGWYKCSVVFTTGTETSLRPQVLQLNNNASVTGDGTSGIFIWGAQLEVGAYPTSYIPSTNTFTSRASTATFIGSNGLIQSAAINVARQNYNPLNLALAPKLLLEESRTNLLQRSEEFNDAVWTKTRASVTANAAIAPDGTLTADTLIENTDTGTHAVSSSFPFVSGNTYTWSVFAKAAERDHVTLTFASAVGGSNLVTIDLVDGSTSALIGPISVSSKPFPNGWHRISTTITATSTGTQSVFILSNNGSTTSYTGDGVSGLFIWGAQLEVGAYPTSYIPTVASTVTRSADISTSAATTRAADISSSAATTRAADVSTSVATIRRADSASMTGSNFSSWYRDDEGTIVTVGDLIDTNSKNIYSISDGSNSNVLQLNTTTVGNYRYGVVLAGVSQSSTAISSGGTLSLSKNTASFGYKLNDLSGSANGANPATDSTATIPIVNRLNLMSTGTGVSISSGHIAKLTYYPKRLSNNDIRALSRKK